jgi:hypothetical protein
LVQPADELHAQLTTHLSISIPLHGTDLNYIAVKVIIENLTASFSLLLILLLLSHSNEIYSTISMVYYCYKCNLLPEKTAESNYYVAFILPGPLSY